MTDALGSKCKGRFAVVGGWELIPRRVDPSDVCCTTAPDTKAYSRLGYITIIVQHNQ
jgi:hypothetical protein